MYKLHLGHMPQSVKDIFLDSNYCHSHNTRNKSHMRVDKQRHEFMSKTFYYQGIRFWNVILENIDINVSLFVFKNMLKQFLLVSQFTLKYSK